MLSALQNIFKIHDLRRKILITLGLIAVYRLGSFIPIPGINAQELARFFDSIAKSQGGTILSIMNMFSGGSLEKLTIFALGIMPYISSSIIIQLLTAVIPALEKISKEGRAGHQKINQYTRYATVALALVQSFFIALWLEHPGKLLEGLNIVINPGWAFRIITVITLTTGTIFIMWVGEQIQERGIGQGISLVIAAGIISRIPVALQQLIGWTTQRTNQTRYLTLAFMAVLFPGGNFSLKRGEQNKRQK